MLIASKITFIKRSSNDFFSYSESRTFDKFRSAAHQHVSADILSKNGFTAQLTYCLIDFIIQQEVLDRANARIQ